MVVREESEVHFRRSQAAGRKKNDKRDGHVGTKRFSRLQETEDDQRPDEIELLFVAQRPTLAENYILRPDARQADFLRDVSAWLREGRIKHREDIVDGLEKAPRALIGLLRGENFGKLLVRVAASGA